MSADSRAFRNPFAEFDSPSKDAVVTCDPGPVQLHPNFEARLREWYDGLLGRLRSSLEHDNDWEDGSVYTGTAGVVMLYLQLHKLTGLDDHLQRALELVGRLPRPSRRHRVSLPCGAAGQLAVEAAAYHRSGHRDKVERRIKKILGMLEEVQTSTSVPDELLYGRVGYLAALLYLRRELAQSLPPGVEDAMRTTVSEVVASGVRLSRQCRSRYPLLYAWHEKQYLGAAHGMSGIMTLLLQVPELLAPSDLSGLVRPTVDKLAELRMPSGNYPSSLESTGGDRLVHWCHGAPGFAHMFCMAHKVFGDARYLQLAEGCADLVWSRGLLKKGYGICHGAAGNAYTFLHLFQLTKEPRQLYRAARFAEWCSEYGRHGCRTPDRPMSLFEGLAGTVYFLAELRTPEEARFPGFCF